MNGEERKNMGGKQLLFIAVCLHVPLTCGDDLNDEGTLMDYLFRGYNPSARPVFNSSDTVNVNVQLSLLQIQELNVRSQVLTTTCLLTLEWTDERLVWTNKTSFLNQLVVAMDNVWRPELAVINGADGIYGDFKEFPGVLRQSGSIRWEPAGVFKTMCSIDITFYPFDDQKCELIFGAWSYYTTKMNLTTARSAVILDSYEGNGEWQVTSTSSERREFYFECCREQRFSNIVFTIHLKRRYPFYLINVIFPGILTSALLLSVFFCVPSQKVQIGVAVLLSFRLFLLNVSDNIPRTSDHVPLLVVYLTCTMAITTLAMVATVFVLNLYEIRDRPVPSWINRLLNLFQDRPKTSLSLRSTHSSGTAPSNASLYQLMRFIEPGRVRPEEDYGEEGIRNQSMFSFPPDESPAPEGRTGVVRLPNRNVAAHGVVGSGTGNAERRREDFAEDWLHLANVCDRFFFWTCLLLTVVSTLVLFHPLIKYRFIQRGSSGERIR